MTTRSQIFYFLKSNGPATAMDIQAHMVGSTLEQTLSELKQLLSAGLLKIDQNDKFHISLHLDAPIKEFRSDGLYNYQQIQSVNRNVPDQSIPPVWINDNVYLIPQRDQGERGTCVGQATAYAADLNAIRLTDWRPDLTSIRRNTIIDIGTVKFIKDELPLGCSSAECAFIISRELGGIRKDQNGSFLDFSVAAWCKKGICTDSLWWNPKSANFDNYEAYPTSRKKTSSQSELHTIDGYADAGDFESIKDAIYKNGFVLMAINVFDNWLDNNCEGVFPDPKGNCIGSHALCWVGYDEKNLYCLHSWAGWSMLGGISKKYFDAAHCTAFVPLDSHETSVAKDSYVKLVVTTDVTCDIKVGNDTYRKTKRVAAAYEPGTLIHIVATPSLVRMPSISKEFVIDNETEIPIVFSSACAASFTNVWERIKSYLEALWK